MTEQEIREIAEAAFKDEFPDVKLDRVNVWPGFGFEDDSPVVDVSIIYDGKYEQFKRPRDFQGADGGRLQGVLGGGG